MRKVLAGILIALVAVFAQIVSLVCDILGK